MSNLTKASLLRLERRAVESWYGAWEHLLEAVAAQLDLDLNGFRRQSSATRLAFFRVRVKSLDSVWDKICTYQRYPDRKLDSLLLRKGISDRTFDISDLVTDLVGARVVFYFEPDLDLPLSYFITYPSLRIDSVEIYTFPRKRPFEPLVQRLREIATTIHGKPEMSDKESGYEGVHLNGRYRPDNILDDRRIRDLKIDKSDLQKVPIEIQICTLLQHAWAQVEHSLNYATKKATRPVGDGGQHREDGEGAALVRDVFLVQKHALKGVELNQNVIWTRYYQRYPSGPLSAKSVDPVKGGRLSVFGSDEEEALIKAHDDVVSDSARTSASGLKRFEKVLEELGTKYSRTKGEGNFLSYEVPRNGEDWARKRAIWMLLGFFSIAGSSSIKRQSDRLVRQCVCNPTSNVDLNTISLYEQIKRGDGYFRLQSGRRDVRFCDPLVGYRLAGLQLQAGATRRAIEVMKDALADRRVLVKSRDRERRVPPEIINCQHMLRRCAEYHWAAFNQDDRSNPEDLDAAQKFIQDAESEDDGPPEEESRNSEMSKILAHEITFSLYSGWDFQAGTFRSGQCKRDFAEVCRSTLEKVEASGIRERFSRGGSLRPQSMAILCWTMKKEEEKNRHIQLALERIHENADRRARPFYFRVVREVASIVSQPFSSESKEKPR